MAKFDLNPTGKADHFEMEILSDEPLDEAIEMLPMADPRITLGDIRSLLAEMDTYLVGNDKVTCIIDQHTANIFAQLRAEAREFSKEEKNP